MKSGSSFRAAGGDVVMALLHSAAKFNDFVVSA